MYASSDKRAGDAGALLSGAPAQGPVQAEAGRERALAHPARPSATRSTACPRSRSRSRTPTRPRRPYAIAAKHGGAKALLRLHSALQQREDQGQAGPRAHRPREDALRSMSRSTLDSKSPRSRASSRVRRTPRERASRRTRSPHRRTPSPRSLVPALACSGAMPELPEVETIRRHLAPHVEGRVLETVEVLDERWSPAAGAGRARAGDAAAGGGAARPARQVPRLGARRRRLPAHAPAHDGHAAARPGPAEPRHVRVRLGLGDHQLVFDDPRRFGTGELALGPEALRRVLRRPARRRAARAGLHRRAPVRARQDLARAGEGVPARSEARRRRRATSTPTRRCSAPACTRCGPRTSSPAPSARPSATASSSRSCSGSSPRAPRSTTSATPTASAAPSRTSSSSTRASTSPARTAATPSASSASRGAAPTSASAASRARARARPRAPARRASQRARPPERAVRRGRHAG